MRSTFLSTLASTSTADSPSPLALFPLLISSRSLLSPSPLSLSSLSLLLSPLPRTRQYPPSLFSQLVGLPMYAYAYWVKQPYTVKTCPDGTTTIAYQFATSGSTCGSYIGNNGQYLYKDLVSKFSPTSGFRKIQEASYAHTWTLYNPTTSEFISCVARLLLARSSSLPPLALSRPLSLPSFALSLARPSLSLPPSLLPRRHRADARALPSPSPSRSPSPSPLALQDRRAGHDLVQGAPGVPLPGRRRQLLRLLGRHERRPLGAGRPVRPHD